MTSDSPSARSANTGTQYHWSFIRIGLWVSLSLLVILFLVGIWSYKQTNELVRQAQEQTASGLAAGLANAVEENMIVRDFGQVEVQLLQAMSNEQVLSGLVANADGTIISEAERNPQTGAVQVVFKDIGQRFTDRTSTQETTPDALEIIRPIDTTSKVGWIKLQIAMKRENALLNGIHQQLLLIVGLVSLIMLLIVGFSLHSTYSKVKTTQEYIEDLNDTLHSAAFYDPLTKLPNRTLLRDRLQQALTLSARSHHYVAICYVDLDGFKQINDVYGHDAGDIVLIEVAKRLTLTVRQHDTVARIGGDEFVLVINDLVNPNDSIPVLDRIVADLTQPIPIGNNFVTVGASIGVSVSQQHGTNPGALITLADKAMYKAKSSGKNQWCFYGNMDEFGG